MSPRKKLNLVRHTIYLDEQTTSEARQYHEELRADFGPSFPWASALAKLVRLGLEAEKLARRGKTRTR